MDPARSTPVSPPKSPMKIKSRVTRSQRLEPKAMEGSVVTERRRSANCKAALFVWRRSASREATSDRSRSSGSRFVGPAALGVTARLGLQRRCGSQNAGQPASQQGQVMKQPVVGRRRRPPQPQQHHSAVRPNTALKRNANSVARRPASAGPAAHFALAVQRATLLASAYSNERSR